MPKSRRYPKNSKKFSFVHGLVGRLVAHLFTLKGKRKRVQKIALGTRLSKVVTIKFYKQ